MHLTRPLDSQTVGPGMGVLTPVFRPLTIGVSYLSYPRYYVQHMMYMYITKYGYMYIN
jgi:hypothetical protein